MNRLKYSLFPLIIFIIIGISIWEAEWFQKKFRSRQYWENRIKETESLILEAEEIKKDYKVLLAMLVYDPPNRQLTNEREIERFAEDLINLYDNPDSVLQKQYTFENLNEFLEYYAYIRLYDSLIVAKQSYIDSIENNILID